MPSTTAARIGVISRTVTTGSSAMHTARWATLLWMPNGSGTKTVGPKKQLHIFSIF